MNTTADEPDGHVGQTDENDISRLQDRKPLALPPNISVHIHVLGRRSEEEVAELRRQALVVTPHPKTSPLRRVEET